jgi:AhpD family alkylhydroperoxidase
MKSKPQPTGTNLKGDTSTLLSSDFRSDRQFEHLSEWVRLGASQARNNDACIEEHRHGLRTLGETEDRLNELDHWRESNAFTKQERAALNLTQAISLHEPEERTLQIIKEAGSYFNIHQILRLTLTIMAVNDWIDFYAIKV